jgi:hypothetical protein
MDSSHEGKIHCSQSKCKTILQANYTFKQCERCRETNKLSRAAARKRKRDEASDNPPRPAPSPPGENSTHQSYGSEGTHHTRETSEPHDSDSEDEGLLGVSNTYVLQVKCTYCSSRNQRIMMVANSFSLNSGDAVNTAKTLHFTDLSNYQRIH